MKKTLAILAATCWLIDLTHAQTPATTGTGGAPTIVGYQIGEQDANSRVWQKIVRTTDTQGHTTLQTNRAYVELASGLNHLVNGQWVASREDIDILSNGTAVATNGQHQAVFPGDIYQGQIELVTPDGLQLFSRPLGLSYFDGTNSVLIAELTNSIGVVSGSNQVIYLNAFTDFAADLRYTYTRAGFEQDIILQEQPPTPESFGLNPATTRLEVLTEFFSPPQPTIQSTAVSVQAGLPMTDQSLGFGVMQMIPGRAFLLGQSAQDSGVKVCKQWQQMNGRQFLVEEVPVEAIAAKLAVLPLPAVQSSSVTTPHTVSKHLVLPPQRLAKAATRPMLLAKAVAPAQGLVLDYQTVNANLTNNTFQGDTTYYISGSVYLYGTNTFEGGAVIKYTNNASLNFDWSTGNINCLAATYRPVIFTAKDDNTVGEPISVSTGSPTNYYANPALNFPYGSSAPALSNFRILYAQVGVEAYSSYPITIDNAQFVNSAVGVEMYSGSFYVRNALFSNVATNFVQAGSQLYGENLTFDTSACLAAPLYPGANPVVLTNCILANVTNLAGGYSYNLSGDHNGFYNSPAFGTGQITNTFYPFRTVGAGSHYLASGCAFTNAGTANIDSTLLANLRQKTTWPPVVYSNVTFLIATNFSPIVSRDTNALPDLGYHYDPLDYFFGGVNAYSNLTFAAGTAVGWFELPGSGGPGYGISLSNDVYATFNGTVTSPCIFARYEAIQEGGNGLWKDKGWLAGLEDGGNYDPSNPAGVTACFTRFVHLAGDPNHIRDGASGQPIVIQANNCEFYGMFEGYNLLDYCTNCLFYRAGVGNSTSANYPIEVLVNCTFFGGAVTFGHWEGGAPYWYSYIHNCAFDNTTFSIDDPFGSNTNYGDYNFNAFDQGATQIVSEGTNNIVVTNGFNWQNSWLGGFYLPVISPLIDAGDRTADQVGLYHYTTQTNQVKETNSIVDIGYHYVAVGANGNPLDSNGDGVPDYVEDANGNGVVDAGEINWALAILLQPTNQTVVQGTNVILSVTAAGSPTIQFQWYSNSVLIANATNATLAFNNVQTNNTGTYYVVVSNNFGSITSSNVILTVLAPPVITQQPTTLDVMQGSNATFSVAATGTIPLSYQWLKNGVTLTDGGSVSGANTSTLTLTGVKTWDAGIYTVAVSNAAGGTASSYAVLRVWTLSVPIASLSDVIGFSSVVAWGTDFSGATEVPPGLMNVVAVAAGWANGLALKRDGTVVAWGDNSYGQLNVPAGLTNAVAIAAGLYHCLAIRNNGTVAGWGDNQFGEINIPSGLTNAMVIAAGNDFSLALKSDGTVIGWGNNSSGQCNVPVGLTNVTTIAAGGAHSLALKSDGTVIGWGNNSWGQCNAPDGLTNVTAIAAGDDCSLALKRDGTMSAWGDNLFGQLYVPATNVTAIALGWTHSLALKSDGTVIGWGDNYYRQCNVPAIFINFGALAAGYGYSLGLGVCLSPDGAGLANIASIVAGDNPLNPWIPPSGDTNSTPPNIILSAPANAQLQ